MNWVGCLSILVVNNLHCSWASIIQRLPIQRHPLSLQVEDHIHACAKLGQQSKSQRLQYKSLVYLPQFFYKQNQAMETEHIIVYNSRPFGSLEEDPSY
jgi:hypothetical protein